jgi:hypothetical protein
MNIVRYITKSSTNMTLKTCQKCRGHKAMVCYSIGPAGSLYSWCNDCRSSFKCTTCNIRFTSQNYLIVHNKDEHPVSNMFAPFVSKLVDEAMAITYSCEKCDYSTTKKQLMVNHNKRKTDCISCGGSSICIHGKQKYQCKQCNGDKYYCFECCTNFCSTQKLAYHMNSAKHKKKYNLLFRDCFLV